MDESPNSYAKYKRQKRFLDDSIYKSVWRRQKKWKQKNQKKTKKKTSGRETDLIMSARELEKWEGTDVEGSWVNFVG